ncbi:MAG: TraR/DksA C4-type zinc finger protein [Deltaproteobacteria bacterium]|nr:TraR/DksA C4-type zinc finger protein [Deltaproteobacteria bacterium]
MDQKSLNKFKKLLLEEKQKVMNNSRKNLDDIKVDVDDLPDETDLAASEVSQNLAFKLRDRERMLLVKINEALGRIDDGTFGACEECEEPIEPRRLEARPVSTLCIACKEREEHREKIFA